MFAPVRYLGFRIGLRYSVFTVFPDLKDIQDIQKLDNTETNANRKILSQPFIFSTDNTLNYDKC